MIQKTHSTGHTFSKSATLRENRPKIPANFWGRGRLVEEDLSAEMMKLAQSTKVSVIGGRDPLAFVEGGAVFWDLFGESKAAPQKKTNLSLWNGPFLGNIWIWKGCTFPG